MDRFNYDKASGGRWNSGRRWDEVDAALLALIRLILDESWSAQRAAAELRAKVTDESVLRRVRTRVQCALAERPTPIAQRAASTLDVLLGDRDSTPSLVGS